MSPFPTPPRVPPGKRPPEVDNPPQPAGNGGPNETAPPPGQPWLSFELRDARPLEHAAAPTMAFTMDVEDSSGREVFTAALSVQIQIEPTKRRYDAETRERLTELFGEPTGATPRRMQWSREHVLLTAFRGRTSVELEVLCNYDLELAATKYFDTLADGEVPLSFHFNGSIYYAAEDERLQIVQVPWDTVADYKMPVEAWKRMIDSYYPQTGWLPVQRETLDAVRRLKVDRGLLTYDQAISELIAESEDRQ